MILCGQGGVCMNLVQEYLSLATEVVSFEAYENKKAVNAYNRQATRMRKIAIEIEQNFPDLKGEFCKLLCHENRKIRLWVAHHILEVMNYDQISRKTALQEIRYHAMTDKGVNGLGNKMWLKGWLKEHPSDRELL